MADPIANNGIVATAFELLEQRPISSLADSSAKAQSAARAWPRALKMCLERADWSFARVLADLSSVGATSAGYVQDSDLPFGFVLPADLVKIRRVEPDGLVWRIDKAFMHADQDGPLRIAYTANITDPAALPETFQVAVAYKLATLLPQLQTSRSKRAALIRDAADAMADALEADRYDASPARADDQPEPVDWVSEAVS